MKVRKLKIKKGDAVIVTAGKDKGRDGVVLSVVAKKGREKQGLRVIVEGVNMVKKHEKPNPQKENPGGIREKEASLAISNVAILNKATGKADRVGFKILEDGRKVRIFKSTGEMVDV